MFANTLLTGGTRGWPKWHFFAAVELFKCILSSCNYCAGEPVPCCNYYFRLAAKHKMSRMGIRAKVRPCKKWGPHSPAANGTTSIQTQSRHQHQKVFQCSRQLRFRFCLCATHNLRDKHAKMSAVKAHTHTHVCTRTHTLAHTFMQTLWRAFPQQFEVQSGVEACRGSCALQDVQFILRWASGVLVAAEEELCWDPWVLSTSVNVF